MASNIPKYNFIYKKDNGTRLKRYSDAQFTNLAYGDVMSTDPNVSSPTISSRYFSGSASDTQVRALKTAFKSYAADSDVYQKYLDGQFQTNLISIPSIFYGSSIERGSVELSVFNISGSLAGKLVDIHRDGELIEIVGSNTGSVAGFVLYNEGFIFLTGSWGVSSSINQEVFINNGASDSFKWKYFGAGLDFDSLRAPQSCSFDINFKGTNRIPSLMMFAHAEKGELNHSNNPTYIKSGSYSYITGSNSFIESETVEIKNIVQSPFISASANFAKETYINKIGIYDKDKNLIAVAKLATPVRKTENREYTFKLKLDF
jgi:hypothetical protein